MLHISRHDGRTAGSGGDRPPVLHPAEAGYGMLKITSPFFPTSVPGPPSSVSLPGPPSSVSLPAPPTRTLAAALPVIVSLPAPPVTFSKLAAWLAAPVLTVRLACTARAVSLVRLTVTGSVAARALKS